MNKKQTAHYQNPLLLEKRTRERTTGFRSWWWYLIAFLAGALLIAAAYFIMFGTFFQVKDITVDGTRLVPSSLVLSSIEADMIGTNAITALLGPKNILFWFFADKTLSLSSRFPEIQKTSVTPSFWDRTVRIDVSERSVESVLCKTAVSECYGIDEDGIIFTRVPTVEGALILRFEDDSTSTIVLGSPYLKDPTWMQNVLKTLSVMREKGFAPATVTVDASTLEEWQAILSSGLAFRFSLHFVPENLGAILDDISAKTDMKALQYFDFRVENRVYYK